MEGSVTSFILTGLESVWYPNKDCEGMMKKVEQPNCMGRPDTIHYMATTWRPRCTQYSHDHSSLMMALCLQLIQ